MGESTLGPLFTPRRTDSSRCASSKEIGDQRWQTIPIYKLTSEQQQDIFLLIPSRVCPEMGKMDPEGLPLKSALGTWHPSFPEEIVRRHPKKSAGQS
jgi:hypothetical protein